MVDEAKYILCPTEFHSMRDAQELTNAFEEALASHSMGSASVNPEVVEIFAELVGNAAEHGMSEYGAHAHIRYIPHRKGFAFDVVIADSGPGIPTTLRRNAGLPKPGTDAEAIGLAIQELVSGTGDPTRGNRPLDDGDRDAQARQKIMDSLRIGTPDPVWRRLSCTAGN